MNDELAVIVVKKRKKIDPSILLRKKIKIKEFDFDLDTYFEEELGEGNGKRDHWYGY